MPSKLAVLTLRTASRRSGLVLALSLIACNASDSATTDEPGTAGPGDSSSSSSSGSSTGSGSDADPTTTGSASTTGTSADDPSGTDPTSGTDSGTTEPACVLDDDNVACDARIVQPGLTLADRPAPTLQHALPLTQTPAPTAAEACDIYAQDCPAGEKCNPYADDGSQKWNATGCFPLARDAGKVGDSCSGSGTLGPDSCEAGAFCMYDPAHGGNFCEPLCGCAANNPTCDAGQSCTSYNGGVLPLCFTLCDPLAPSACADDEVCVLKNYKFLCSADASGGLGTLGDACQGANGCDPGHSCEIAAYVPGHCDGAPSCCTPLCTLSAPDCPAGSHCLEYFGGFGLETPVCLEDVGYCVADDAALVDAPARLR